MQTRKFDVQMNHKCVVCSKTVYPLEKITVSQKSFHRACFRCGECNSTLHPDMFVEKDNKFYCRRHVPSSTQKTSSEVSREERVDRLTEVSNTVSTSQGPEKKNSATPTVAKEQRSLPGQSQRQPNPVDSPSESLVSTESLLDLPNMANMSPDLQVWQNKQLENFLKSLEVARRTILGQEKCAHCGVVIPKDDNCGMKDGRIYCSKCLNTPLVLLGIFKKK